MGGRPPLKAQEAVAQGQQGPAAWWGWVAQQAQRRRTCPLWRHTSAPWSASARSCACASRAAQVRKRSPVGCASLSCSVAAETAQPAAAAASRQALQCARALPVLSKSLGLSTWPQASNPAFCCSPFNNRTTKIQNSPGHSSIGVSAGVWAFGASMLLDSWVPRVTRQVTRIHKDRSLIAYRWG